jgi:UDP-N-acetylglucosamine 2-epimerase (non-hydrolysing)
MRIDLIIGARPNVMKVAPLYHALKRALNDFAVRLIHTGQHYDYNLSQTFFNDFKLPEPDVFLDVRSGTHAVQTAKVMEGYEPVCLADRPDLLIVVGDVNSTVACALTAKKCDVKVAHLEAGLRSGDRSMPEEINRLVVDAIADIFWTPSPDADENLRREGHPAAAIQRVGNIMIDAYEMVAPRIVAADKWKALNLHRMGYMVATFHRPSNVDDPRALAVLVDQLVRCGAKTPVVFPIHPRTRASLEAQGLLPLLASGGVIATDPLGYIDFMSLVTNCKLVVTDSGGVQEETSYLGIPCLTVRSTTERPITISMGTNRLTSSEQLAESVGQRLVEVSQPRPSIPLWDGRAAKRIVKSLKKSVKVH